MKKNYLLILLFSCFTVYAQGEQDLRTILDSQINNSEINIPKGTYLLDLTNGKYAYIFSNKKNITIDGNGSTIICNRQNQAFQFTNCENVTFKNFVVEYDPPCASQGTIIEMSADKRTWTVELHENYPTSGIQNDRILVYDKNNRELKQNFTTITASGMTTETVGSKTRLRFTSSWSNTTTNPVVVGDYVSFSVVAQGNIQAHTFIISSCKYMRFENVTVYDSNSFSFLEYDGLQNHYYRCIVTRKLNDPKYPQDRLRAGIADAFHSKFAEIGPIVEECRLEYTGDDCIAINGNFHPVYETNATERTISFLTTANSLSNVYVRANDKFVCVNNDGTIRGRAVVTDISTAYPTQSQRDVTFSKLSHVINSENFVYGVKVKLDTWINGSATGDVIYSENRIGSGFKVLRDTVGGNRSRAILIKSSDGIIDGCVIKNSAMSAIALAPEFNWMEAGCPSGVVVRNNTIDNCMFDSNMNWTTQFAALVVVSQAPNGQFAPAGSINKISIYDNTITNCPFPAVGLTSIDGVYFANNTIEKSSWDRTHGKDFGVPNNRDLYRVNTVNFSTTTDVNPPMSIIEDETESVKLIIENGQISLSQIPDDFEEIKLYDLTGNLIFVSKDPKFSIATFSKGIYLIQVKTRTQNSSTKFII